MSQLNKKIHLNEQCQNANSTLPCPEGRLGQFPIGAGALNGCHKHKKGDCISFAGQADKKSGCAAPGLERAKANRRQPLDKTTGDAGVEKYSEHGKENSRHSIAEDNESGSAHGRPVSGRHICANHGTVNANHLYRTITGVYL
jgi:hypothetical protein